MENKLTDNEIIKALECHKERELKTCRNCPLLNIDGCAYEMSGNALDLINRLQAEVKRLKDFATAKCNDCAGCTSWKCDCANIKAEAIEKYREKVKQNLIDKGFYPAIVKCVLDEVEKEMVDKNDL